MPVPLWLVSLVISWIVCSPSVLNAVARLVCYAQKYDHCTCPLQDLHWLRFQKKYNSNWLYSFSTAVTTWHPHTSSTIFTEPMNKTKSLQQLRSGYQLHLNSAQSVTDPIFPMAAHAWNSLPTSVTTGTSLDSFKRQLKTLLLTKSFLELQFNVCRVLEALCLCHVNLHILITIIIISQMCVVCTTNFIISPNEGTSASCTILQPTADNSMQHSSVKYKAKSLKEQIS